jgi:hypothetical protein
MMSTSNDTAPMDDMAQVIRHGYGIDQEAMDT